MASLKCTVISGWLGFLLLLGASGIHGQYDGSTTASSGSSGGSGSTGGPVGGSTGGSAGGSTDSSGSTSPPTCTAAPNTQCRPICSGAGTNAFEQNCIVPDEIDVAPAGVLTVLFPHNSSEPASAYTVDFGKELHPVNLQNQPTDIEWAGNAAYNYTLIMADLDVPSRYSNFSLAPINHWFVINIQNLNVSTGLSIMPFLGPAPTANAGLHRYVLLVYQQSAWINPLEATFAGWGSSLLTRINLDVRGFAKSHNLGNPVAGNFFQAQIIQT